jgi:LacI family transcriptional regulator
MGGRVHVLDEQRISDKLLAQLEHYTGKSIKEQLLAFFALEDSRAADMIALCMHHDIAIPENIAVLGVDNDDLIHQGLSIGLSSVDTHQLGLGRAAGQKLAQIMGEAMPLPLTKTLHAPLGVTVCQSTDVLAVEDPLVSTALQWIKRHHSEGIQAIDVAKMLGVTQQTMQKAFAEHHMRTPAQEIRHHRMVAAEDKLINSKANIADIAKASGYSSVDTFINHFNRVHGKTPSQYRKEYLEL